MKRGKERGTLKTTSLSSLKFVRWYVSCEIAESNKVGELQWNGNPLLRSEKMFSG